MVQGAVAEGSVRPKVVVTADEEVVVALKLAKAGWCGGNPEAVMEMSAEMVMAALQYEEFIPQFEKKWKELNDTKGTK